MSISLVSKAYTVIKREITSDAFDSAGGDVLIEKGKHVLKEVRFGVADGLVFWSGIKTTVFCYLSWKFGFMIQEIILSN
jgi:hypothetical protein